MSKIAILGDLHIGARDGRSMFHDHFDKFFSEIFFPYCLKNDIKTVFQLGDTYDRRKFIDYASLKRSKSYLFEPLKNAGMTMYMIVGNHDIALRHSLEINSPTLLLQEYDNIIKITSPKEVEIGGTEFLMLPWICNDNHTECMNAIKETKSELCLGHLEIQGFMMNAGMTAKDGMTSNIFNKFDAVYSGHFHHRGSSGNIHYVGTPYELTFLDVGNIKGFHILDSKTRDIEFIENPNRLFEKFIYDDTIEDYTNFDASRFANKFVKIVVREKKDFYQFDKFLERVYSSNSYDIKIVEDIVNITPDEMDESIDIEDTISILQHYVEASEVDVDKEELSKFIKQLYLEALDATV